MVFEVKSWIKENAKNGCFGLVVLWISGGQA
jgi:hypothetical protein